MNSRITCSCRSRDFLSEIRRQVLIQGLVAEISGATLQRWLSADALRRSWIFPRDLDFAAKAGRILDLYNPVFSWRANRSDFTSDPLACRARFVRRN